VINCSIMINNDYSIITSSEIHLECCLLPILKRKVEHVQREQNQKANQETDSAFLVSKRETTTYY